MIVDFHNHYFPPEYLDAIRSGGSHFQVTSDDDGNPVLHSPGDYNVLVPGHRDLDFREKALDEAGVRMQVITFTAPDLPTPDASYLPALCPAFRVIVNHVVPVRLICDV